MFDQNPNILREETLEKEKKVSVSIELDCLFRILQLIEPLLLRDHTRRAKGVI